MSSLAFLDGYDVTNPFNVGGTWRGERTSYEFYTHPDYNPSAFYTHDLGVVILDEPYYLPDGKEYGKLPPQDLLNTLSADYPNAQIDFEAVGYGLQNIHPLFLEADRKRYVSYPKFISLEGDFAIITSNNANTGGTCVSCS